MLESSFWADSSDTDSTDEGIGESTPLWSSDDATNYDHECTKVTNIMTGSDESLDQSDQGSDGVPGHPQKPQTPLQPPQVPEPSFALSNLVQMAMMPYSTMM